MTSISATIAHEAAESRPHHHRRRNASARRRRREEDRRLVEGVLRGDDDAFRRLVERYQRPLYWIAHDVLLDGEEARDVVQETFIRVHAALRSFDRTRDFQNWIFRIARNLAIDSYRRRRRRERPVDDSILSGNEGTDGAPTRLGAGRPEGDGRAAAAELTDQVSEVLAGLPVDYRVALTLREFHAMTPREIAEVTDCSYPTARWRLHRARALFRKAWEARFGAPAADQGET